MDNNLDIQWELKVPIFRNRIITGQLGLAIGIPFGALVIIFILVQAYEGLILIAVLFLLTTLLLILVFGGTYDVRFRVDEKGILCENQPRQAKKVKAMSKITVLLGLFARNPTVMGTGMIGGSRIQVMLAWKNIKKIKYYNRDMSILLSGGFGDKIAVFCTDENFDKLKTLISERAVNVKR
jgi:hypothetical protein